MKVVKASQPGVDTKTRWIKKGGKFVFGYKQHTVVDDNVLVRAVETTAANRHDSQPMLALLDKAGIEPGCWFHADKTYGSQKHREALKARGIQNCIQDKVGKNKPLTTGPLQRNKLITRLRYAVERTFGSQARWFGGKILIICWKFYEKGKMRLLNRKQVKNTRKQGDLAFPRGNS